MIGKGKSISHGVAALEYDLAKEIDGQAAATEIYSGIAAVQAHFFPCRVAYHRIRH